MIKGTHFDMREFKKWAKRAPKKIEAGMRRGLPKVGQVYARDVKEKMSGAVLKRRTGNLARSVTVSKVEGSGLSLSLRVGSDLVYAPIHEYGGTIRPKKSQYLAIPLKAARTGAGVARFSPRQAPGKTFVAKSKAGNLIIFSKAGSSLTPLFVLKKSVRIPARPIWEPAVKRTEEDARRLLFAEVKKELER